MWEGKPLLFGNGNGISASMKNKINAKFTLRGSWAWTDQDNYWPWLQEYVQVDNGSYRPVNGGYGRDANRNIESLSIAMGHHPTMTKGRTFANGVQTNNGKNDMEFSSVYEAGLGTGFEFQFNAATYLMNRRIQEDDPFVLMITGWNEWIAGCFYAEEGQTQPMAGGNYNFAYVDQFNAMFSRDGEPMKLRDGEEVGFGDNYYYQMTDYIRRYKGTGAVSSASGQVSIDLSDPAAWENVGPVYGDNVGDVTWRHEEGYFSNLTYVENSGRNDLVAAKVSQDAEYLYFSVTTARDLIVDNGSNWMNLFIDLDNDPSTGWEGYDLALNRARDGHYVSVESLKDGWAGVHVGQALYTVDGNRMVIRLSKAAVGLSGHISALCFKWADNSTLAGNVMEFMDLGDTAPNDRFSYLYVCPEDMGNSAVTADTYTLLSADGTTVEIRDETRPLPGYESGDKPLPDTSEPDTPPDESHKAPDEDMETPAVVWTYSPRLKVMILLTGVVVGLSLYAAMVVPYFVKKKRGSR